MTLFFHFLAGGILPIVVFVLLSIPDTVPQGVQIRWWFTIFPTFDVCMSIILSTCAGSIAEIRNAAIGAGADLEPYDDNIWAWTNLTGNAVVMCLVGICSGILLICLEAQCLKRVFNFTFRALPPAKEISEVDEDVENEEMRVETLCKADKMRNSQQLTNDEETAAMLRSFDFTKEAVRVSNFRKVYTSLIGDPFPAVENVSFGLQQGECFALLGVNGAGKSTTFKSLTNDTIPTSGLIKVAGYDISTHFGEARKQMGYCPQHDAVFPLLSCEEHLNFYAKIKGIPRNRIHEIVEKAIVELNLSDHRHKAAGTLSGGNRRKLSVAIALLGNPPIILLDEPSAGMDPEARRFMWSVVEKIS